MPHRAPMLWIDSVISWTAEGGCCQTMLKDSPLLFNSDKHLRPAMLIELMAQSFGFVRAAQIQSTASELAAASLKKAFLAAFSNAILPSGKTLTSIHPGDVVDIFVSDFRELHPLTLFKGCVRDSAGIVLATASLKVYGERAETF